MGKEELLELKTRRIIYNCISKNPGLHERKLSRQLNIPLSTLDYHLFFLKKRELIVDQVEGGYNRYYISRKVGTKDKRAIAVLRQKPVRTIVIFLLLNPNSFHRDISKHLELARSTTSFHLNKLVDLEIITRNQIGRETDYSIREVSYISDLLIIYRKSFFDDAVDRFVEAWLELHPRHLQKSKKENQEINLLFFF